MVRCFLSEDLLTMYNTYLTEKNSLLWNAVVHIKTKKKVEARTQL